MDHTLGFIFGLARGALIAVIAFLAIGWLMTERPEWLVEARTLPMLEVGADLLLRLSPNRNVEPSESDKSLNPIKGVPGKPTPGKEPTDSPEKTGYKSIEQQLLEQLVRGGDASK